MQGLKMSGLLQRALLRFPQLDEPTYHLDPTYRYENVGSGPNPVHNLNVNVMRGQFGKFMLSQAPTPLEMEGWLAMLFDEGVVVVFMLTKLVENEILKANDYLTFVGGLLSVVTSVKQYGAFQISLLGIKKGGETKQVAHVWYQGWPDHGLLPAADLFELFRIYDAYARPGQFTLIHCSAGLGRAGTFFMALIGHLKFSKLLKEYSGAIKRIIDVEDELFKIDEDAPTLGNQVRIQALDNELDRLRSSVGSITAKIESARLSEDAIVELVNDMRKSRPGIVQNPHQLALVILALGYPLSLAEGVDELMREGAPALAPPAPAPAAAVDADLPTAP
jgi:protein tyrosine phosphatase